MHRGTTVMDEYNNVLLLNQDCYPGCPVCLPAEATELSHEAIEDRLQNIRRYTQQVYVGVEAFANMALLRKVLTFCSTIGLTPLLLTCGQFVENSDQFKTLIQDLHRHGSFELILVLDNQHVNSMSESRFRNLILGINKSAYLNPDVLYLLKDGETLSNIILSDDEVNKLLIIHTKRANSLFTLLSPNGTSFDNSYPYQGTQTDPTKVQLMRRLDHTSVTSPLSNVNHKVYPLSFNALVLETTYYCNARCNHCYTSCGPHVSQQRISVEQAKAIFDQATDLPNLKKRCHVAGGEATIFWNELIQILAAARDKGFINSIVTNGFWGRTPERALVKISQLKEAGVQEIELSIDAMHQDFISPFAVSNVIRAAKQLGIGITLRVCTTRTLRASKVIEKLAADDQSDISIAINKVNPVGRAKEAIPAEDIWVEPGIPSGACYPLLNLTINALGDVYPCCAGSELCPSLRLGNCFNNTLHDIMLSIPRNFLVRTLVHAGPAYLVSLLKESGMEHKLLPGYAGYCQLCNHIFTDPEMNDAVQQIISQKAIDGSLNPFLEPGR